jgi:hypothetical protein
MKENHPDVRLYRENLERPQHNRFASRSQTGNPPKYKSVVLLALFKNLLTQLRGQRLSIFGGGNKLRSSSSYSLTFLELFSWKVPVKK